jgi:hypothetical protein
MIIFGVYWIRQCLLSKFHIYKAPKLAVKFHDKFTINLNRILTTELADFSLLRH